MYLTLLTAAQATMAAGTYAFTTIANGGGNPTSAAVDGSGNVYVIEANSIKECAAPCSSVFTLLTGSQAGAQFVGATVSSDGTIYWLSGSALKECVAPCSAASIATILSVSGHSTGSAIAVDSQDNVYFADSSSSIMKCIAPCGSGSTPTTIVAGVSNLSGIAVDGSGRVFFTSYTATFNSTTHQFAYVGFLNECAAPCSIAATKTTLQTMDGSTLGRLAVDGYGNLYVTNQTQLLLCLAPCSGSSVLTSIATGINWGGLAVDGSNNLLFTVNSSTADIRQAAIPATQSGTAPTITSISPTSGSANGGTTVTINGTNLTGATAVKFGSVAATIIANTGTTITVTSPASSAGTVDLTVMTSGGTSATSAADEFTFANVAPALTSLSPTYGKPATGTAATDAKRTTKVTISGSGFTGATAVKFGTQAATSFSVVSDGLITAVAPAQSVGVVDVTVVTSNGTSAVVGEDQFVYAVNSGVFHGAYSGGTTIDLGRRERLKDPLTTQYQLFYFGSTRVYSQYDALKADAHVTFASPAGTGLVPIALENGERWSMFDYRPSVSSVSPTKAANTGSTTVTVRGASFGNDSDQVQVFFGSQLGTNVSVLADGKLTVTAPSGSRGAVAVYVRTPGGSSLATQTARFTYPGKGSSSTSPAILSMSPSNGASGASVTMKGGGFTGATAVHFGSTDATSFSVKSDSQIVAVAPFGSDDVDVTVETPDGTSPVTPAAIFTYYNSVPSPVVGPGTGGTTVRISGASFGSTTTVTFSGTPASSVTITSATQLTAVTPAGTGKGPIEVTTGPTTKTVGQFSYLPVLSTVSPRVLNPWTSSTTVTVSGKNFGTTATGLQVLFGSTPGTNVKLLSATKITVTAPRFSNDRAVPIYVVTAGGTSIPPTAYFSTPDGGGGFYYTASFAFWCDYPIKTVPASC